MGWLTATAQVVRRLHAGRLVNSPSRAPGPARLATALTGVENGEISLFADETVRQWIARRGPRGTGIAENGWPRRRAARLGLLRPRRQHWILAGRFSCRTQIHELDGGGREGRHGGEACSPVTARKGTVKAMSE
ncbi:hypothetical protein [Amycolatopsis sp. cmx-4-83]|uniref:hypothetical protein n=1 Tax=Amycolatopsis sp. cmx-4-83 TaxID=2790940 RepID=UPI00397CB178